MLLRSPSSRRPAATLAEAGLVYPVVALLLLGVVIVAMGVFRYQLVAELAREAARWASVHGAQYKSETGNAMATPSSIYSNAIQPRAAGLDTSGMTFTSSAGQGTYLGFTVSWTNSSEIPIYNDTNGNPVTNQVTVTVTYNWVPVAYLGAVTLSSTSVMAMQY
jgi:hypothetical protein